MNSSFESCVDWLDTFHTRYVTVHGWASILVCVFGSIANGLNIAVLTRKEMCSPTNAILTGLAVADLLVMLEYIPYAVHSYLYLRPSRDTFTYGWTVFVLFHALFAQVFHTISIWLTVTLAIWRYIAVAHPQKNREWCSFRRSIVAIVSAYLFCPVICVPLYVTTSIKESSQLIGNDGMVVNASLYNVTDLPEGVTNGTIFLVSLSKNAKKLNFWMYSVVIKLIPCVALTVLSLRLILALVEAKKRRKKLSEATMVKSEEVSAEFCSGKKRKKKSTRLMDKERQTDRTTKMLLAILLLFLLTEFPQGVLGLLSVILGTKFFENCYVKLGRWFRIFLFLCERKKEDLSRKDICKSKGFLTELPHNEDKDKKFGEELNGNLGVSKLECIGVCKSLWFICLVFLYKFALLFNFFFRFFVRSLRRRKCSFKHFLVSFFTKYDLFDLEIIIMTIPKQFFYDSLLTNSY